MNTCSGNFINATNLTTIVFFFFFLKTDACYNSVLDSKTSNKSSEILIDTCRDIGNGIGTGICLRIS